MLHMATAWSCCDISAVRHVVLVLWRVCAHNCPGEGDMLRTYTNQRAEPVAMIALLMSVVSDWWWLWYEWRSCVRILRQEQWPGGSTTGKVCSLWLHCYRPRSRGVNTFGSICVFACACVCPSVCMRFTVLTVWPLTLIFLAWGSTLTLVSLEL